LVTNTGPVIPAAAMDPLLHPSAPRRDPPAMPRPRPVHRPGHHPGPRRCPHHPPV